MEIYQNLPETTRAELIEYIIFLFDQPTPAHEQVLQSIFQTISEVEASNFARITTQPSTFYLDDTSHAVRPDIAIVLDGNRGKIISDMHFKGVPDFVVEVLSIGSKRHDAVKKKSVYQRFGVKEYWIIDPESKIAQQYAMRSGQLQLQAELNGSIKSELLGLEIQF